MRYPVVGPALSYPKRLVRGVMIILPLSINVFYQASALTMRRVLSLEYPSFISAILFDDRS